MQASNEDEEVDGKIKVSTNFLLLEPNTKKLLNFFSGICLAILQALPICVRRFVMCYYMMQLFSLEQKASLP